MKYKIEKIDSHTWIIQEYDDSNSVYFFLLEGSERAVLIDAGFGTINLKSICSSLTSLPVTVLLTHGHGDHIGGCGYFDEVLLSVEDFILYDAQLKADTLVKFTDDPRYPLNPVIHRIPDSKTLSLGGRTLEIIPIPGHSKGSICVLDKEYRRLFTGDSCCKAHVLFQLENCATFEEYLSALKDLWERRDEYDITWPAHHTYPLEKDIILQFIECTAIFLKGQLPISHHQGVLGEYRLVEYKDVGIEF